MNHEEMKLASLIHEIKTMLNEDDIRLSDNFIDLGGNSIMAMVIVEKLQSNNGVKINLAQLMGCPIGNIEMTLIKM